MTDSLRLSRIGIFAYHGVNAEERQLGQRFYISLLCRLDLREAGRDDDYSKTVCYAALAEAVQEVAVIQRFSTLEGLAEAVAARCLADHPRLNSVTVTVEKPSAPVAALLDTIAVEITRQRS